MEHVLIYIGTGLIAGFLAGLFGIGGGLIIVPVLILAFTAQHFPEPFILHMALGSSLASIIFTSLASALTHHKRRAIQWGVVRKISLPIVIGTLLGTVFAAQISSRTLTVIFVIFLTYTATQLIINFKPKSNQELPKWLGLSLAGSGIGFISSLVGIGGGTLSVPFLMWRNVDLRRAIATSAAIGVPISVSGALGYLINGLSVAELPRFSVGFIYLPATLGIVASSVLSATIGAKLAHRLPVNILKKTFAVLLYGVGIKMICGLA